MNAPILVTGGTGNIGRRAVAMLRAAGHDVRVLSRHPRADEPGIQHVEGDTVAGRGVEDALRGVDVVMHLAGGAKGDDTAARHLATAARSAGVRHLLFISVIGADRMPIGYFRAKAEAERAIAGSGVPWTVLRAAQLHDFVLPLVKGLAALPFTPAPRGLRFEPVDADGVAARLVELALGAPAGRVPDLAGPEVLGIRELVGAYNARRHRRRPAVPIPIPGRIGRAYLAGDNLAGADAERDHVSWKAYLAHRADMPIRAR